MVDRDDFLRVLRERRQYASFWEWRDKPSKEASVLQSYLETRTRYSMPRIESVERPATDPPDFLARLAAGGPLGIELTEFVCPETIRRNEVNRTPGEQVYRDWQPPEVVERLRAIVARKDRADYHVPRDVPIELVIHTDEYIVRHEEYRPILLQAEFGPVSRIAKAVILFSYDPNVEHCPLVELRIR